MTEQSSLPERWLRGPVDNIIPALQPVAHALLQAKDEINQIMNGFPDLLLWESVAELASVAFHLQHIKGVLDRLFTYADGYPLSEEQIKYLSLEGKKKEGLQVSELVENLNHQVEFSLEKLQHLEEIELQDKRTVGKKQLPSTRLGLLFHAAEHTMRHTGQLLVTVQVLKSSHSII
jgi:uncharacterized damage-inducible protein DinB